MDLCVNITYDSETDVYIAENDEVGISLESGSLDRLIERLRVAVPEMAVENGVSCTGLNIYADIHKTVFV